MNQNESGQNIVKDTYVAIDIWTKPLGRRHYYASEIVSRHTGPGNAGSSLLTEALRQNPNIRRLTLRKQAVEPEIEPVPSQYETAPSPREEKKDEDYFDLGSRILSETPQEFLKPPTPEKNIASQAQPLPAEEASSKGKIKPKKASIKVRVRKALYDYTEIQLEEMEEKVDELINSDGFYDEVVPIDANTDYHKRNGMDMRLLVLLGALAIVVAALIYTVKSF